MEAGSDRRGPCGGGRERGKEAERAGRGGSAGYWVGLSGEKKKKKKRKDWARLKARGKRERESFRNLKNKQIKFKFKLKEFKFKLKLKQINNAGSVDAQNLCNIIFLFMAK